MSTSDILRGLAYVITSMALLITAVAKLVKVLLDARRDVRRKRKKRR